MDARTKRTLLRVGTLLGAVVICTLIVVLFPNLDPRFIEAVYGLGITAALGLDQFAKNSGDNAVPTLAAVNTAIVNQVPVPPPAVAVPEVAVLTTPTVVPPAPGV
jgi:hypothetical protein